jgi:glycosyltransferase involved in cell wall biosynthesis
MEHQKKRGKIPEHSQFQWDKITRYRTKFSDYELPSVAVIIPTYNCAQTINVTIESVLEQDYPNFEILIVDGGSDDRTLELVNGWKDPRIRVFCITTHQRYEMLNKGLSQTNSTYVSFLFPGDFYIHHDTVRYMMSVALENQLPDLVYCGTLIRDGKSPAKILFRELTVKRLQRGQQPTSLQSCWFKSEVFKQIGKFNPDYVLRGGFDLLCRFMAVKHFKSVRTYRVLTDYDLRLVTRSMVLRHFWETLVTVQKNYGLWVAFLWMFRQRDISRFFRLWLRSVRIAVLGR